MKSGGRGFIFLTCRFLLASILLLASPFNFFLFLFRIDGKREEDVSFFDYYPSYYLHHLLIFFPFSGFELMENGKREFLYPAK